MRRIATLLLATLVFPDVAIAADQEDLTVAIVYNIIRFTEFQPQPSDRVTLCVHAPSEMAGAFSRLEGRPVPNGRISVRPISRTDQRDGCTVTYISGETRPPVGAGMTISDAPQFARNGGTVGLFRFGRQVLFELNPQAGATRGVRFSSRLLSLAAIVRTR